MTSMMCTPSERDLIHALRRGIETARAAGRTGPDELGAAALGEVLAAWPHLARDDAAAAVERLLPEQLAGPAGEPRN